MPPNLEKLVSDTGLHNILGTPVFSERLVSTDSAFQYNKVDESPLYSTASGFINVEIETTSISTFRLRLLRRILIRDGYMLARIWLAYVLFLIVLVVLNTEVWINDYIFRVVIGLFIGGLGVTATYLLQKTLRTQSILIVSFFVGVITLFVIYQVLSSLSCWCCKKDSEFEHMCSMAGLVRDAFAEHEIKAWICFGTLLGAHREAHLPFQAMPWEHDFDVCVMQSDWNKITHILSDVPGLRQKNALADDGRWLSRFSRTYVDFYRYYYKDDTNSTLCTRDGTRGRELCMPAELTEPIGSTTACNMPWPAPNKILESIEALYGRRFENPEFPPGLTGLMCGLRADCPLAGVKPYYNFDLRHVLP